MITLVYHVEPKDAPAEKEWLKGMKVYPSSEAYSDWVQNKIYVRFCCIVSPETASVIKLRHPLQIQAQYKQR